MMHPSWPLLAALLAATAASAAGPAPLAAQGCLGCHGPDGAGSGAVPRLAGREARELDGLLRAYRNDARQGTIMNRIARGYTEDEIAALSAHFAVIR